MFVNNSGRIVIGSLSGADTGGNCVAIANGQVSSSQRHDLLAVFYSANSQLGLLLDGAQVAVGYLNSAACVAVSDPLRVGYNNDDNDYAGAESMSAPSGEAGLDTPVQGGKGHSAVPDS